MLLMFCFLDMELLNHLEFASQAIYHKRVQVTCRLCNCRTYCLRLERFDFSHWYETMTVVVRFFLMLVRTGLAKIGIAP